MLDLFINAMAFAVIAAISVAVFIIVLVFIIGLVVEWASRQKKG